MHYLDNSATTAPCKAALDEYLRVAEKVFGNPSSKNELGFAAERELAAAKETIARAIGAQSDEIIVTNSGSAANNLALFGACKRGGGVVVSEGEHPSVYQPAKELGRRGAKVGYIASKGGAFSLDALERALGRDTELVSVMMVGNETGAINPLLQIRDIVRAKAPGALFHIDAVQGFMKLAFSVRALGCDLLTVSAHKIEAPRGAAALYCRKGVVLAPLIFGGGQERGLFSGTENVAAAAAFAAAIRDHNPEAEAAAIKELSRYARQELAKIRGVLPVRAQNAADHIIAISVPGKKTEILLHLLEQRGVIVSGGSACNAKKAVKSRALADFGLTDEQIAGSLRISLSRRNVKSDIDALCAALAQIAEE